MYKKLIIILLIIVVICSVIIFKFTKSNQNSSVNQNKDSQFSIGANIHFIEPNADEVNMIHKAGFKIVRMDLFWTSIENKKGIYDFSHYDKLVESMSKNNIKIIFILDYSNPLYDNGQSPYSDEGRRAFVNFAAQAVKHYKGKQIMWEIWNEPNEGFWKPEPNVDNYFKLALETAKEIRLHDKNAFIVAPAMIGFDYSYLSYLGKNGLFKYINAVSVHPYRHEQPETVIEDYKNLRNLIEKYPHNKNIQLFSGEWGYSAAWEGMNDMKQAQYCIRQYLTNIMSGVNISIWYDWKDDGTERNNPEHNFGVIYNDLAPKPVYYAIKNVNTILDGYRYVKMIDVGSKDDYVLMFKKGDKVVYAAWTIGKKHNININLTHNKVQVIDYLMERDYTDKVSGGKYNIDLDGNVKYILN